MLNSEKEKSDRGQVRTAIIGGVFALLAACISGVFLILNTMINNQEANISPTQPNSLITQTASPIMAGCQETNGQSLSSLPYAPSNGCVLIVEWWIPPDPSNCGILITTAAPGISRNISGRWWNINPSYVDSHVQGYIQVHPGCKVDDQR